uniref:Uncharacterized protein n=1 Tax=Picea glauca TaxID=3330 RepID=A0A124GMW3_PICGL|nr:hypothetical protein ABT39_MTgene6366 [Picea glauca]
MLSTIIYPFGLWDIYGVFLSYLFPRLWRGLVIIGRNQPKERVSQAYDQTAEVPLKYREPAQR